LQQQNSYANREIRTAQMAPLGHRQLFAGLRGPAERVRRDHPDRADGQSAHGIPVADPVDGRTAFVRGVDGVRGARESGRVDGQFEKGTDRRAGQTVRRNGGHGQAAGSVEKRQIRHPRRRGASPGDHREDQRANSILSPFERHRVQ